jgi:pimeloyl-ACP methyl ester carboxylesterase
MAEAVEIEELRVPVAGGSLAVYRLGDSGRQPVIAVHGITGTSRAWLPVARALGDRATLIAVDLRGRGASHDLPAPYGPSVHVADILAVLDHLSLERAVLAGHSLGAYVVAGVTAAHAQRVASALLIDGGLPIPGSERIDPHEFAAALLGPALARLHLRFPDRDAYRQWWREHPAFAGGQVEDPDLAAYADHDLRGTAPELRPSANPDAVRADAGELGQLGGAAHRLTVPARLLCAPRGLLNDPNPMQPIQLAEQWAAGDPGRRQATLVPDVNHYTITLAPAGAAAVADAIASAIAPPGAEVSGSSAAPSVGAEWT